MGKDDEVLPDSQDEAELETLDMLISEFSPLKEQPSLSKFACSNIEGQRAWRGRCNSSQILAYLYFDNMLTLPP